MKVQENPDQYPNKERRSPTARLQRVTQIFETELWIALALFLVLDVLLTMVGISLGLVEGNPIARMAIHRFGGGGLVLLKVAAVGIALIGCARIEDQFRPVIPLSISIIWGFAVGVNALLILTAM
ncbi:MAG: hypothetical protein ACI9EZ_001892 [Halobacteriales archaeon]|jgi:hypothetical protein